MFKSKLIPVLTILILGLLSCKKEEFTVDCLPTDLQKGVIAFYPFNDGSINDESANSNDLINTTDAQATTDRNGNPGCAFVFDNQMGGDEFLTTPNPGFLNCLTSFSIAIWYEAIDTTIGGVNLEVLVGRGQGLKCPDRKGEWSVGLYDCRRPVFGHNNSIWINRITSPYNCQSEINLLTNSWYHIVAIRNGDDYKIYLNRSLNAQTNGNADCGTSLHLAQDIGDLFIGKEFTGKLDDILIYNRALTAQEVDQLYQLGSCCH